MPDIALSATSADPHDSTWTVDLGCTRPAAYQEAWFTEIRPYAGHIMVSGKKQLPTCGISDLFHQVEDTTGTSRLVELRDVLYVPEMKFNLLSIAQVLKMDGRVVFCATRCSLFMDKDFKLHIKLALDMDLFQFQAKTTQDAIQRGRGLGLCGRQPANAFVAPPDHV
ncbi:hypothetical protein PHMEG_00012236 [Phytophthora megakarya]|uniref:Retrovirus-related Pol polyprotein from transposon TNT 1-94-like beta-barrel domain-containing protein n=1 Tax=Phytophthora megakarya TaxID=4795 RepID=A0A225W9A5_9STRA|nr:hypothetical protein PHMEG_00012236 [Phytophthora megakarya]